MECVKFDSGFDRDRIKQLVQQYLQGSQIKGQVLFLSDSGENRLDLATWRFDQKDYTSLKESGFKHMLMELLDILIIYRNEHLQPNASAGVVTISGSEAAISWLPISEVKTLREKGLEQN